MRENAIQATSKNVTVGRYVMLNHFTYKPFRVVFCNTQEGLTQIVGVGLESYDNLRARKTFTLEEFDAAGYIFAEADAEEKL